MDYCYKWQLGRYQFKWGTSVRIYKKEFSKPFLLSSCPKLTKETKDTFSKRPKIIIRGVTKRLSAFLDLCGIGMLVAVHTIMVKKDRGCYPKILLILANSNLMDWYHKKTFYVARIPQGSLRYPISFLEKLPIKNTSDCSYMLFADYMLFLNATEERRKSEKELIEFIDKQIIDSLVYELYFKEKFHEDGLYPEPKEYLLETVSKHLKPINYDRWAELYWKNSLRVISQKKRKRN